MKLLIIIFILIKLTLPVYSTVIDSLQFNEKLDQIFDVVNNDSLFHNFLEVICGKSINIRVIDTSFCFYLSPNDFHEIYYPGQRKVDSMYWKRYKVFDNSYDSCFYKRVYLPINKRYKPPNYNYELYIHIIEENIYKCILINPNGFTFTPSEKNQIFIKYIFIFDEKNLLKRTVKDRSSQTIKDLEND